MTLDGQNAASYSVISNIKKFRKIHGGNDDIFIYKFVDV